MGSTNLSSLKSTPKITDIRGLVESERYYVGIAEKVEDLDDQLKKAIWIATGKKDLKTLRQLINLWERLAEVEVAELPPFSFILKSPEDVCRFAEYISKESLGFDVTLSLVKWIRNSEIKGFRNEKELAKKFNENKEKVGLIWFGKSLGNEEEYLKVIKEIISNPEATLAMWHTTGIKTKSLLGYLFGKDGICLEVLIDEKGFIENCQVSDKRWDDLIKWDKKYMTAFYVL